MAQAAPTPAIPESRNRLSPVEQARVIHLLFVEELSVDVVAIRFGVGATTIRRIRSAHFEKIDSRKAKNGDISNGR